MHTHKEPIGKNFLCTNTQLISMSSNTSVGGVLMLTRCTVMYNDTQRCTWSIHTKTEEVHKTESHEVGITLEETTDNMDNGWNSTSRRKENTDTVDMVMECYCWSENRKYTKVNKTNVSSGRRETLKTLTTAGYHTYSNISMSKI